MLNTSSFIYGRTLTLDYRWLAKPEQPLKASFFADVLERQRSALGNGRVDYFVCASENLCLVSAFFIDAELLDQRGRQIAFAAGFTSDARLCRDFAYYLPETLSNFGLWLDNIRSCLGSVVASDGQIDLLGFDLRMAAASSQVDGLNNYSSRKNNGNFIQDSYGPPPISLSTENRNVNKSQATLKGTEWLIAQANLLRRKPSTPEVLCSFDCSGLGNLLDKIDYEQTAIAQGDDPFSSSQMKSAPTVGVYQARSKADEIRDFAKVAKAYPSNELATQTSVTRAPIVPDSLGSAQKKDATGVRITRDIRSVFDRLRGKSPPSGDSIDDEA